MIFAALLLFICAAACLVPASLAARPPVDRARAYAWIITSFSFVTVASAVAGDFPDALIGVALIIAAIYRLKRRAQR